MAHNGAEHKCGESLVEIKATAEAPYHFADAGLPNVYLSGISYYVCKVCNKFVKVEIPAVGELMAALGRLVVTKTSLLNGHDVKFLRKRLGIKGADFASMLSVSPEQLSRWENDKNAMSGSTDRLIRIAYAFMSKDSKLRAMAARVKEQFQQWSTSIHGAGDHERVMASYSAQRQWEVVAEAA